MTATAFQEAGHAVQALKEGIAIRKVTIVGEGDAAGHAAYAQRMRTYYGEVRLPVAERRAWTALAGAIAQRRHHPRSVRRYHSDGDRAVAADLAMAICSSAREAEAWLNLCTVQVEQHIGHQWPVVEAAAAALVERGTLGSVELMVEVAAAARRCCT